MRKASFNGSDAQKVKNRTMTVASNFKFENFERLNTIVGEVSQINKKQTVMRTGKVGMSDKVLDLIKNRIKSNYDKLYQNYDDNKKTILKQIQQAQTNMSGQNAINKGFQNVIKEKTNYDKVKSELQVKHKKLKKLTQIRDQLKEGTLHNNQLNQMIVQKYNLMQSLQSYRQILDYQTSVLNNMKSERRSVKLLLKQRYDRVLAEEQFKGHKISRLQDTNHAKKASLKRIEQQLKREEQCQMPQSLAVQLQRKLQQYQGKQVHQNIVKHENIISEQLRKRVQLQQSRQKQALRGQRVLKQKEQEKEYQIAYNFYLIKQQEQQKIKKICGVSSLSQIVNNSLQSDLQKLQLIKKQIEVSIQYMKSNNCRIKADINSILTNKQENILTNNQEHIHSNKQDHNQNDLHHNQNDLLKAEHQYLTAQKQLTGLQGNSFRKFKFVNQWHAIIQMMNLTEIPKQGLAQSLKEIMYRIVNQQNQKDKASSRYHLNENSINQRINFKRPSFKQECYSQSSILQGKL